MPIAIDIPRQKGDVLLIAPIGGKPAVLFRGETDQLMLKTAVAEIPVNGSIDSAISEMEEVIRSNGRGD